MYSTAVEVRVDVGCCHQHINSLIILLSTIAFLPKECQTIMIYLAIHYLSLQTID